MWLPAFLFGKKMNHLPEDLANKLTEIAIRQFKVGFEHKKDRMEDICKNEEFYNLRKITVPVGRFAVPLPIMGGFVDMLMSKIDEPPSSKFKHTDLADLKKMRMVSMAFEKDSSPIRGNWAQIDRWSKKLACFSGRAILKFYAESDPKYKATFGIVDHEDFICEPMGGGDLNNHLFRGQDSIFRTKAQLERGARSGLYDAGQVRKLVATATDGVMKNTETFYANKKRRFSLLGLNLLDNTYVGQPIYKFIEWVMDYEGEKYYLLFNYATGIWIRAHVLEEVFESKLDPWVSWATHEDPNVFWSKAPCDDMRPICDTAETLLNQELYNRRKRNMGQRAFDPNIFKDPLQLPWRPDGLIEGDTSGGKQLSQGIYEFKTDQLQGTIDLFAYLDAFAGRKTGISPQAPGAPEQAEEKVGIRFADLQAMADLIGLRNKSYRKAQDEIALRYYWGTIEHLPEKTLIEMIGEGGIGWDKVKKEGSHAFDIELVGGTAEMSANLAKAKKREDVLVLISKDQQLKDECNPRWRLKQMLQHGEYEDADIKGAMTKGDLGDIEILSEAAKAVQDIAQGREPKLIRGANTAFLQYILDFATDKITFEEKSDKPEDVKNREIYTKLIKYFQRHIPIATENAARKASLLMAAPKRPEEASKRPMLKPTEEMAVEEPLPGSPGEAIKTGQEASLLFRGGAALPTER